MKKLNIITPLMMLYLTLSFTGKTHATEDEFVMPSLDTPAIETICDIDGIAGKAKGLCIAYCEAQDCDRLMNDPAQSPSNREATSCQRIASNYEDAATDLGISTTLPCEEPPLPPCPCEQLSNWPTNTTYTYNGATSFGNTCSETAEALSIPANELPVIGLVYNDVCFRGQVGDFTVIEVTPEESLACHNQLNAFRASEELEECGLHP